jgi:protein SCO1/2
VVILRLSIPEQQQGAPAPLPIQGRFGAVPDMELIERSGETVRLSDLRGKVWVAGFIFTRCHETCPMITGIMAQLRAELPSDVQMVSITVDPRYDSPDVLRDYARNYKAGDDWWFLTGPRDELYELIIEGFKLGVRENSDPEKLPGERIIHSTRLVVVDRNGEIRGYYDSTDPGLVRMLVQNVQTLRNEE